mmetsp:Transcript_11597/g.28573  ORF Transcript_11597/g.28573 Transcript_11597/m.28573 type:complete len:302 (+) Transcript_11597:236-1141(+)
MLRMPCSSSSSSSNAPARLSKPAIPCAPSSFASAKPVAPDACRWSTSTPCSIRSCTIDLSLFPTAEKSGKAPARFSTFGSAPCSRSSLARSKFLRCTAHSSAVSLAWVRALTSALCFIKYMAVSVCPAHDAMIRGVTPLRLPWLTSAPCRTSSRTSFASPLSAASVRGVSLNMNVPVFGSPPDSNKAFTATAWRFFTAMKSGVAPWHAFDWWFGLAPLSRSSRAVAAWPFCEARKSGVTSSSLVFRSGCILNWSSASTTFVWPFCAAMWSGVAPACVAISGFALCRSRSCTQRRWLFCEAM